jgi:hypothetical protein
MISGIFVFSISTPLFGINYILNTNYGVFSVIISLFYLATFLLCSFYQKKQK